MQVSDRGVVALMQHEGIVPAPYLDSVGVWTFGIGHTAAAGAPNPATMPRGMPADLDEALAHVTAVFRADLARYTSDVLRAVTVQLAQHELDALVSFHFNTGAIARAELTKALNAGDRVVAGALFMNWIKPKELTERRRQEQTLFFNGTYPTGPVTVWQVNAAGKIIWTPVRQLKSDRALALVVDADPVVDASPAGVLTFGSRDPRNRQIQVRLKALGLYARDLDDVWGNGQQGGLDALAVATTTIQSLINGE